MYLPRPGAKLGVAGEGPTACSIARSGRDDLEGKRPWSRKSLAGVAGSILGGYCADRWGYRTTAVQMIVILGFSLLT
jgi:hypothetical protein